MKEDDVPCYRALQGFQDETHLPHPEVANTGVPVLGTKSATSGTPDVVRSGASKDDPVGAIRSSGIAPIAPPNPAPD